MTRKEQIIRLRNELLLTWHLDARKKASGKKSLQLLRAAPLARIPWLVHGFSTRQGGVSKVYGARAFNLGYATADSRSAVERNRRAFANAVGNPDEQNNRRRVIWPLVTVQQIHSDLVHHISKTRTHPLAGDGIITQTPGVLLAVLAADCLPLIVVDMRLRAVGVFHAGWRGTLKRIAEKGVGEMRRHFGSRPRDLKAVIGPSVRGCCYEVGSELREKFCSQFSYAKDLFRENRQSDEVRDKYPLLFLTARAPGHSELPKKIFLNLAEANRRQLVAAGVPARNIFDLDLCTSCRTDLFFSHRAEKGTTGRMMAAVGIRGSKDQRGFKKNR